MLITNTVLRLPYPFTERADLVNIQVMYMKTGIFHALEFTVQILSMVVKSSTVKTKELSNVSQGYFYKLLKIYCGIHVHRKKD